MGKGTCVTGTCVTGTFVTGKGTSNDLTITSCFSFTKEIILVSSFAIVKK